MRPILLISLIAVALGGSGCISHAIQRGNIIEVDETDFGMVIAASSGPTATPAIHFGLIRTKILFVPTSTNKIYAPQFTTSGSLNDNGRALIFGGSDSSSTGETSVVTTNKPVVPAAPNAVLSAGTNAVVHLIDNSVK